jgi:hypothetical protein
MADAKHTPGPWRVFNGTDVFPDDEDREATRHIADCDMAGSIGGDEQRANARLISAAPDLLDSLVGYMSAVETMNAAMKDGLNVHGAVAALVGWEDMAKAAIAKATTLTIQDQTQR